MLRWRSEGRGGMAKSEGRGASCGGSNANVVPPSHRKRWKTNIAAGGAQAGIHIRDYVKAVFEDTRGTRKESVLHGSLVRSLKIAQAQSGHEYKDQASVEGTRGLHRLRSPDDSAFLFSPNHAFIFIWKKIILLLVLCQVSYIPIILCFGYSSGNFRSLDILVEVFFLLDILVKCNTAMQIRRNDGGVELVAQRFRVVKLYLFSHRFVIDAVACVPGWAFRGRGAGDEGFSPFFLPPLIKVLETGDFTRLVSLMHIFSFARIFGLQSHVINVLVRMKYSKTVAIVLILGTYLLLIHIFTCITWVAAPLTMQLRLDSVDELLLEHDENTDGHRSIYIVALHVTMLAMIGADLRPFTDWENLYFTFLTFVGIFMIAYVTASFTRVIANLFQDEYRYREKMEKLWNEMYNLGLPRRVQNRIVQYYDFMWHELNTLNGSTEFFLPELSKNLQIEVTLFQRMGVLNNMPLLLSLENEAAQVEILISLKLRVYMPGDFIFVGGNVTDELYYIQRGQCEVTLHKTTNASKDTAVKHILRSGAAYSEWFWLSQMLESGEENREQELTDRQRKVHKQIKQRSKLSRFYSDLRALSFCQVFVLSKINFDSICQKYALDTSRIADNWIVRTKKGLYGSIVVPKASDRKKGKKDMRNRSPGSQTSSNGSNSTSLRDSVAVTPKERLKKAIKILPSSIVMIRNRGTFAASVQPDQSTQPDHSVQSDQSIQPDQSEKPDQSENPDQELSTAKQEKGPLPQPGKFRRPRSGGGPSSTVLHRIVLQRPSNMVRNYAKRRERFRAASSQRKLSAESSFLQAIQEKESFLTKADEAEKLDAELSVPLSDTSKAKKHATRSHRQRNRAKCADDAGNPHSHHTPRRNAAPATEIGETMEQLTHARVSVIEGKIDAMTTALQRLERTVSMGSATSEAGSGRVTSPVPASVSSPFSDPTVSSGGGSGKKALPPLQDFRQKKPPPLNFEV